MTTARAIIDWLKRNQQQVVADVCQLYSFAQHTTRGAGSCGILSTVACVASIAQTANRPAHSSVSDKHHVLDRMRLLLILVRLSAAADAPIS